MTGILLDFAMRTSCGPFLVFHIYIRILHIIHSIVSSKISADLMDDFGPPSRRERRWRWPMENNR